jgi:hypothetical protein
MPEIPLSMLKQVFRNMRVKSGWDTSGELLWGYFFTDPDPEKLQPVAEFLEKDGYRVVKVYPTDDGSTTFLHVEKVERHTAASLHERNRELTAVAKRFGVESYDGMDVGPAQGTSNA